MLGFDCALVAVPQLEERRIETAQGLRGSCQRSDHRPVAGLSRFCLAASALDPEAYGAVEYVIDLSVLVATLVDGGPGIVGVQRSAQDPSGLSGLAFQILMARLLLVAIGVPLVALVALSTMKPAVPAGLVWLFALSLLAAPWLYVIAAPLVDRNLLRDFSGLGRTAPGSEVAPRSGWRPATTRR